MSQQIYIQSKIDNQKFKIDKKIIDSSNLLKNICEITDITEPIIINCSGDSLKTYINLIKNYQSIEEENRDLKFEKTFYNSVAADKKELIKLCQDLCILDSDIFLNSVADYILGILDDGLQWYEMKEYLGLENDFTENERELMNKSEKIEYFLSINTKNFKFPFPNKSLCSMKTDFSTPLNILFARIIQRSNVKISRLLSLINKSIKNEVDRHPFKLTKFCCSPDNWTFEIFTRGFINGNLWFCLHRESGNEKLFEILIKRNVISEQKFNIMYDEEREPEKEIFIQNYNSFDFNASKVTEVIFQTTYKSIYQFDITKCRSQSIFYNFSTVKEYRSGIKFEEVYNHLIAKDLSKQIVLETDDFFQFFSFHTCLRLHKKANASKFYELKLFQGHKKINPEFKEFVTNHMEDDGIIKSSEIIIHEIRGFKNVKILGYYEYSVSTLKKLLYFI